MAIDSNERKRLKVLLKDDNNTNKNVDQFYIFYK